MRAPLDPEQQLVRQPWSLLEPLLPGEASEFPAVMKSLRTFANALLTWNRGVSNLISRNDEMRLVERHLFESLFPAKMIVESGCRRLLDLGSGGGLPAIPLGLAGVGEHWTLVESRRNKTLFMRKVEQDMKLKQFEIVTGRLETLLEEGETDLTCDAFTSRATMTIVPTLELAGQVVKPGGRAFLWKGSGHVDEMAANVDAWSPDWIHLSTETIGEGPNVVVVFERKATSIE